MPNSLYGKDFTIHNMLCVFLLIAILVQGTFGISCYECGEMTDGRNFLKIENIPECEMEVPENRERHIKQCPPEDKCCFSLREHFTVSFWGHAATAKVFIRGCCSSLNETYHHLPSSSPPPLATSSVFRAEILSQTVMKGNIKTRVMFCNNDACNLRKIPWSTPVEHPEVSVQCPTSSPLKSELRSSRPKKEASSGLSNIDTEEQHLIHLSEMESSKKFFNEQETFFVNGRAEPISAPSTSRQPRNSSRFTAAESRRGDEALNEGEDEDRSSFCECNCNCPTLVCSSGFSISASIISTFLIISSALGL